MLTLVRVKGTGVYGAMESRDRSGGALVTIGRVRRYWSRARISRYLVINPHEIR